MLVTEEMCVRGIDEKVIAALKRGDKVRFSPDINLPPTAVRDIALKAGIMIFECRIGGGISWEKP